VTTANRIREGVDTRSQNGIVNNYHTTPCNNPEDHRFCFPGFRFLFEVMLRLCNYLRLLSTDGGMTVE
jgi:hypothetical protein